VAIIVVKWSDEKQVVWLVPDNEDVGVFFGGIVSLSSGGSRKPR
jgi:hypothetical protein